MEMPTIPSDEAQEVSEFLEAARELAVAREMEAAEFIPDWDAVEAGRSEDAASAEAQAAPPSLVEDEGARRSYWQAQSLVELEQMNLQPRWSKATPPASADRITDWRSIIGRTISILRSALNTGREALAQAAMRNLSTLHRAMMQMHRRAPQHVPLALVLDRGKPGRLRPRPGDPGAAESAGPLELDQVMTQVNQLAAMTLAKGTVQRHLKDLVDAGYVEIAGQPTRCYARTPRGYTEMDQDTRGLRALLGLKLHTRWKKQA